MFVNGTRVYCGRCLMTDKLMKNWITNRNTVQLHSTCYANSSCSLRSRYQ